MLYIYQEHCVALQCLEGQIMQRHITWLDGMARYTGQLQAQGKKINNKKYKTVHKEFQTKPFRKWEKQMKISKKNVFWNSRNKIFFLNAMFWVFQYKEYAIWTEAPGGAIDLVV